jgi:hypothetical protein
MSRVDVIHGIRKVELKSWEQFSDYVKELYEFRSAFIYRGQGRAEWNVLSRIDRLEARFPRTPNRLGNVPADLDIPPASRETHLRAFKEASREKRGQNPPELTDDQWWALGQHHGLSTPLLDWTRSPFVALFFAFEEEVLPDGQGGLNPPSARAVFAVSSNAICDTYQHHDMKPPRPFSPLAETSPRLINQSGVFLRMPKGCDLEAYVHNRFSNETASSVHGTERCILEKITIPNQGRRACLRHLDKMNINRMTLFPDLDGAARYMDALWELEFDTSMGHIPDVLLLD